KTNAVTGRFFKPRGPEEFYDTYADFDNVNDLIKDPAQQAKVAELKLAMRKKQLELFDSGLLPEQMRMRRAAENNMTIYEMIRNPKIYPLEKYLDAADLALEVDTKNLEALVRGMSDSDEGIRWWSIVGLNLLERQGSSAKAVVEKALEDKEHEVAIMAAWTLVKMGDKEKAMLFFDSMLHGECKNVMLLHNVVDWMGEAGLPLAKKYIEKGGSTQGDYGVVSILGHVAELNGWWKNPKAHKAKKKK
ncbi:MAG: hypothetical protein NE330_12810, partial [Lentisphaeraceae bacterium]|nr:hypothetical protein [Lentisphaeraceae bacterium]